MGSAPTSVQKSEQDGIQVWRLFGNWVRNLPPPTRSAAMSSLEEEAENLVVDISEVGQMDAWGVCLVCDVLEEAHPNAAWVVGPLQVRIADDVDLDLELRGIHLHRFQNLVSAVQKVQSLKK